MTRRASKRKVTDRERWEKLGQALRAIRKTLGLSQEDMADILGVSWATYQRYEKGKINPENIIPLLEKKLDISEIEIKLRAGLYSIDDIKKVLNLTQAVTKYTSNVSEEDYIKVPIITRVGAGEVITDDYILIERGKLPSLSVKAFKVVGDSMEPRLYEGEIVLIDPNDVELKDGAIYLFARSNGNNENVLTLRIAKKIGENWFMVPANEKYPIVKLTDEWRVIGKAVEVVEIKTRKLTVV